MRLLHEITIKYEKKMRESLNGVGLSIIDYRVMKSIDEIDGEVSQARVSRREEINKMTVSKSVKKLKKLKFVKNHVSKENGKILIKLTATGSKVLGKSSGELELISEEFLSNLTTPQKKKFEEICMIIKKRIDQK